MHIKYTAREGSTTFKSAVTTSLQQLIYNAVNSGIPLSALFDIKHEYAGEWYQFNNAGTATSKTLQLSITKDRLPFFTENKNVRVAQVKLCAKKKDGQDATAIPFNNGGSLVKDSFSLYSAVIPVTQQDISDTTSLAIQVTMNVADIAKIDDLFLLLSYSFYA